MPILSFVQTKGGTGKTTLSQGIACSKIFSKAFNKVALVEIDPQGTLADWIGERIVQKRALKNVGFYQLAGLELSVLTAKLENILAENEAVILDVPGESVGGFATKLALNLSDVVLIPMRTSTNDEASFGRNLWPVIQESLRNNKAEFYIIPTFIHPQTNPKNIRDYFKGIMPEQIGCLSTVLPFRSTYENFSREGRTLAEFSTSVKNNSRAYTQAKKSEADMELIAKEILSLIRE
jgi:cellulose biosynthesis protein BcsQ